MIAATSPFEASKVDGPAPPRISSLRYLLTHVIAVPVLIALLAYSIEYGTEDLAASRFFFDAATSSFRAQHSMVLEVLGHRVANALPIVIGGVAIAAGLTGFYARVLRTWSAILLSIGAAAVLGPVAVGLLKDATTQHCPIVMQTFGGLVNYETERAGPFWAHAAYQAGHCLPSGHAAGGFALMSLYFAGWAAGRPAWRWAGLAIGVGAGLIFSAVRVAQGAHFLSATLWSAEVDWMVCVLIFWPLLRGTRADGRNKVSAA